MAKLTDPTAVVRPVPGPAAFARMRESPVSGTEGRGLQILGQSIDQATEEIYKAQKVEEERVNTLRAEDAFSQLRERQLDLTVGEGGFSRFKGSDAVTRPLLPEYRKRFEDAEREISTALANDAQREKFKRRSGVAQLQYMEEILRHQAREGDVYAKQVYDGVLYTEQRNAVARWDSASDVALSLERIKAAVEERAERYGWDAEYRNAQIQAESGKVHAAVIQQAIASGNHRYAEEWYKLHRDDVDLTTAKQLEVTVRDGAKKELAAQYDARYLASEADPKALDLLRKEVLGNESLDENRRNILVGRIQNRQFVLERRAEVAETRRLRVIERGVNDLNANTLAGFEPNLDRFMPLLAAAKGTELEAEVTRAVQLAGATRAFRNSPPLVQEQLITQGEAGLRTDPTKFDRNVLSAWRSIYEAQRRQVNEAPVSFAVRQGIIEPPRPLDLTNPGASAEALHERFAIARGVANRYQAPFKPLTPEETTLMRSALAGAGAEQKRAYFGAMRAAAGSDTAGYMGIMKQLAPDDPVSAIAGSLTMRGRDAAATLILRGQEILHPPQRGDGKPDGPGLLPMPPETDMRLGFDSYVREAFVGNPEARNAHYQATRAAYAALSVDAGDRDTKSLNNNRWQQAMEAALGQVEKYNGRRIVLPSGTDYADFEDGVRLRIEDLVQRGDLDRTWTVSRLRDLPLKSIGDGRYVFKSGDGVVVDKAGRPVLINFNLEPSAPLAPIEPAPKPKGEPDAYSKAIGEVGFSSLLRALVPGGANQP